MFLSSCVGAAVAVTTHQGKVEGQVLLVETELKVGKPFRSSNVMLSFDPTHSEIPFRQQGVAETDGTSVQTVYTHVSLLEQDGSISSVPIPQITKVTLVDASLQKELREALVSKLAQVGRWDGDG